MHARGRALAYGEWLQPSNLAACQRCEIPGGSMEEPSRVAPSLHNVCSRALDDARGMPRQAVVGRPPVEVHENPVEPRWGPTDAPTTRIEGTAHAARCGTGSHGVRGPGRSYRFGTERSAVPLPPRRGRVRSPLERWRCSCAAVSTRVAKGVALARASRAKTGGCGQLRIAPSFARRLLVEGHRCSWRDEAHERR